MYNNYGYNPPIIIKHTSSHVDWLKISSIVAGVVFSLLIIIFIIVYFVKIKPSKKSKIISKPIRLVEGIVEELIKIILDLSKEIEVLGKDAISGLEEAYNISEKAIVNEYDNISRDIVDEYDTASKDIVDEFDSIIHDISSGLKTAENAIVREFDSIESSISEVADSVLSDFSKLETEFTSGFGSIGTVIDSSISGLESAYKTAESDDITAENYINSLGSTVKSGFNGALGSIGI